MATLANSPSSPIIKAAIELADKHAIARWAGLMVDDEDRIMDWMSSGASARIARVIAHGQKILDERFEDGVFE